IAAASRAMGTLNQGAQGLVGALAGVPGPVGIIASGFQAVQGLVSSILQDMHAMPQTVAEMNQRLNETGNILRTVRAEGAPRQEAFRTAFAGSPEFLEALRQAQNQGNLNRQLALAQQAQVIARQQVEQEEAGGAQGRATQLEQLLRARRAAFQT